VRQPRPDRILLGKERQGAADSPPALPARDGAADLVLPTGPLHLLEVGEVGALPGQIDEVGEDHPSDADVVERVRRARVDVLLDVAVDGLVGALLDVVPGQARLQVSRHVADLHAPDLVVQGTQRHGWLVSRLRALSLARVCSSAWVGGVGGVRERGICWRNREMGVLGPGRAGPGLC
jgi:nucleotide-binding universal stress UspA family protein